MTTDLEKQFFNTFGIDPIGCNDNKNCTGALDCTQCPNAKYPQITDRVLLELICILAEHYSLEEQNWFIVQTTIDKLKEWLLEEFIEIDRIGSSNIIEHQVQALFKEER